MLGKLGVYEKVLVYCEIHGECKELEQLISTDIWFSFSYAEYVVKGRFKLGEDVINLNLHASKWYQRFLESL